MYRITNVERVPKCEEITELVDKSVCDSCFEFCLSV